MAESRLSYLLAVYAEGRSGQQEESDLLQMINDPANEMELKELLQGVIKNIPSTAELSNSSEKAILEAIFNADKQAVHPAPRISLLRVKWVRYAAAAVLMVAAGLWLWNQNSKNKTQIVDSKKVAVVQDIKPGGDKAMLTLADGSTIILDSASNGELALQGSSRVIKESGQIVYDSHQASEDSRMVYNTMSTPRGGQYQLRLPDGTKVWLNAASSITYPTAFSGSERKVEVKGEVYFEVMKNKEKPFIIDVDRRSSVEVLGTSFNINSYADETTIKTTLIEGKLRVKIGEKGSLLNSGQQAEIAQNGNSVKIIEDVDIDQALAWKNGIFNLQDVDLREFARQLERWYDIKVKYEGTIPKTNFEGKLSRGEKLSTVLQWFSKLGIRNRLEGTTLILGNK